MPGLENKFPFKKAYFLGGVYMKSCILKLKNCPAIKWEKKHRRISPFAMQRRKGRPPAPYLFEVCSSLHSKGEIRRCFFSHLMAGQFFSFNMQDFIYTPPQKIGLLKRKLIFQRHLRCHFSFQGGYVVERNQRNQVGKEAMNNNSYCPIKKSKLSWWWFQPIWKYLSNWIISPGKVKQKIYIYIHPWS